MVLASPIILMRVWKLLLGPWSFPEPTWWLREARAFAVVSMALSILAAVKRKARGKQESLVKSWTNLASPYQEELVA